MPHRSTDELLLSHTVRLKGLAAIDDVVVATGLDPAVVATELARLAAEGHATERTGRLSGWSLTPAGKAANDALVAAEQAEAGAGATVEDAYRRFLALNGDTLALCTDWQLRDGAPNDHTDRAYDDGTIDRLRAIDAAIDPILTDLAAALERFGRYRSRFAAALARVTAGEHEWFTRPMIDSYHTVWFELHEDLLATLGIARSSETTSA